MSSSAPTTILTTGDAPTLIHSSSMAAHPACPRPRRLRWPWCLKQAQKNDNLRHHYLGMVLYMLTYLLEVHDLMSLFYNDLVSWMSTCLNQNIIRYS
jgi:hypothetical protein